MSKQEVIICHNLEENLNKAINQCPHDKLFVLADEHTRELCMLDKMFPEVDDAIVAQQVCEIFDRPQIGCRQNRHGVLVF